jgi:diguanylate cyclase (GGDEF)-like protein
VTARLFEDPGELRPVERLATAAGVGLGIAAVAGIDYVTGIELRVHPMYFLPLSVAAWRLGRTAALVTALVCTLSWAFVNYAAGLRYSNTEVWIFNLATQGLSFLTVALLIASLRVAVRHERALSRTDPVTSLPNSRAFHEDAARMLAWCARKRHPVVLGYIDLDDFKAVNDSLGHAAGDRMLRDVGVVLRTSLRGSDLSARLGGDEFAVLLPETTAEEARVLFARLSAALKGVLSTPGLRVTGTIGGVVFPTASDSVEAMLHRADMRMYAAKVAGKDRVEIEVVGDEGPGPPPPPPVPPPQ